MKKILALLILLTLVVSVFAACKKDEEPADDNTPSDTPVVEQGPTLEDAKTVLRDIYKNKENQNTASDWDVVSGVVVGETRFTITWTTNSNDVVITESLTEGMVTVDVIPEEPEAAINYTLTATISDAEGNTTTTSFNFVVPKFQVNTWEEYCKAVKGDALVVEGIVVAINSKAAGNSRNHLFILDETGVGGYYIYQMDKDPVADFGVEVGMTVRVSGNAEPYGTAPNVLPEINGDVNVKILKNGEKTDFDYIDMTEKFKVGANFNSFVAMPVVLKNVLIGGQNMSEANKQYLYFTVNGIESYVRTYVTDFPTGLAADAKAEIDALHASKQGYTADVYGILITYSGNPYIIPTSVDCFNNFKLPERTDEQKVAFELDAIAGIPTDVVKATEFTLPSVGVTYDAVKFTWTCDDATVVIGEDGKVSLVPGNDAKTLKFTVTATIGEGDTAATGTKEFTVKVAESFTMSETLAYVPYISIGTHGEPLYLDGTAGARYLNTTTDASAAAKIYAEKVEGGYKFYILVEGVKNYLTIYTNSDNKDAAKFDPEGNTVFNYNETVNAFIANYNGTDKYLGTYLDKNGAPYSTISVSNASYITGDNVANVGVTQFPLQLLPIAINTALQGSFTQTQPDEKTLYLDGTAGERYLNTTELASEAVAVYAEKVVGGFKFYILVDEVKNYITIYNNDAGKTSVKYDPAGETVFTYKAKVNAWATTFDGKDRYLGSYYSSKDNKTFNTISVSDLSYITGDNAANVGVTQYPLTFAIPAHVCSFGEATCTAPATCTCGATQGEALGHNKVEGVCANCGAKYVTVTEAAALEDGTLVIIEATVSKITYNWSDSNKNMSADITDGTTTLNAYKLYSKVEVNDIISLTGKVGSFNGKKQIAEGATAVKVGTHECSEYTDATCTDAPKCKICGKAQEGGEALGHTWGETGVTTAPTCTTAGYDTFTCTVCPFTERRNEVAALGHEDTNSDGKCDRTVGEGTCGADVDAPIVTAQYVKVNSAAEFTSGTYILVNGLGKALGTYDNGWVTAAEATVQNDVATCDAIWIVTVDGTKATIKDANGTFIKPKTGNSNGIASGEYWWDIVWNDNNTVTFKGVGSDTTRLAFNGASDTLKFRSYKTTTTGSVYNDQFTAYKLG